MELDQVTAEIRPRSDLEAMDLGMALVRRDFWRCLAAWWLALGLPTVVGCWLLWDHPLWLLALFWWGKPAGSRLVLLQLSRRLFGERPGWGALVREVPAAWRRRFFYRFCWARWSPVSPVTLAVEELEGLRGPAYQRRLAGLLQQGGGGRATGWFLLADVAAFWCGLVVLAVVGMLVPMGQDEPWLAALEEWDPARPLIIPLVLLRMLAGCLLVGISLTDLFVTGAGFGWYVNARTWVEGWDVELAFRRLGERLGKGTGVMVLLAGACLLALPVCGQDANSFVGTKNSLARQLESPEPPAAEDPEPTAVRNPHEVIREVKADPDFKVHKVTRKVRKLDGVEPIRLPFAEALAWVTLVAAVAGGLWLLVRLLWHYREVFSRTGEAAPAAPPAARVVMGMAVTPGSLPDDIPGTVWGWWQQGRRQEALGLLYRGTISRMIEHARMAIEEADTEGDCLKRVEQAGAVAFPTYFGGLTQVWMRLAYASQVPTDEAVAALCRDWPYAARRPA